MTRTKLVRLQRAYNRDRRSGKHYGKTLTRLGLRWEALPHFARLVSRATGPALNGLAKAHNV